MHQHKELPPLPEPWITDGSRGVADDARRHYAEDQMIEYGKACVAASQAADAVPVGGVRWDLFPGYLIDHCEGDTITEEGLQFAVARMLKSADYLAAAAHPSPTTAPASESIDCDWFTTLLDDFGVAYEADDETEKALAHIAIIERVDAHTAAQVAASKPAESDCRRYCQREADEASKPAAASGEALEAARQNMDLVVVRLASMSDDAEWCDVEHMEELADQALPCARAVIAYLATPPAQAPALPATGEALTDEQILRLAWANEIGWAENTNFTEFNADEDEAKPYLKFARDIIAALKEKTA